MKSLSFKQRMVAGFFSRIPIEKLRRLAKISFIIPYYHMISDEALPHLANLYPYKNVEQFESDLDFLLEHFHPVDFLTVLKSCQEGTPLPEDSFLLTFDDGFREIHDIARPVLLKKGIPALVFVNSAFIDNVECCYSHKASLIVEALRGGFSERVLKGLEDRLALTFNSFDNLVKYILSIKYNDRATLDIIAAEVGFDCGGFLLNQRPYLTSTQIDRMLMEGFHIGAHSIDHPLYHLLSPEAQVHQTIESMKEIRSRFSLEYGAFAFPHSDNGVSRKTFHEIYESGVVDITFGTAGLLDDPIARNLQRVSFEKPMLSARKLLSMRYAKRIMGNISRRTTKEYV